MSRDQYRAFARESTDDPRAWVQLKNALARQIEMGILEPGDEVALTIEAQDFGVSPKTATKAFRALVEEGKLLPSPHLGAPYRVPQNASSREVTAGDEARVAGKS